MDPKHLNLRILLSYQGVIQVSLLHLTQQHFSSRHRSILPLEEEVSPFPQLNGLKLLYKLLWSTQIFSHISAPITFSYCVFPSQIQLFLVVSGKLPPVLMLLLCTLDLLVPSCHSLPSEITPKCGIFLRVGDCSHLQNSSAWIAVGLQVQPCWRKKSTSVHPATHLHRPGMFGRAVNPLPPAPSQILRDDDETHSLADSAQARHFVLN